MYGYRLERAKLKPIKSTVRMDSNLSADENLLGTHPPRRLAAAVFALPRLFLSRSLVSSSHACAWTCDRLTITDMRNLCDLYTGLTIAFSSQNNGIIVYVDDNSFLFANLPIYTLMKYTVKYSTNLLFRFILNVKFGI